MCKTIFCDSVLTFYLSFILYKMREKDKKQHPYILDRTTLRSRYRITSKLHFRSLRSYLGATIASRLLKELLMRHRFTTRKHIAFQAVPLSLGEPPHNVITLESTFLIEGADYSSQMRKTWDSEGADSLLSRIN